MPEDLMSVEEALERILARVATLAPEAQPILEALGQVLAEDITAPFDVPPLDNSAMDGYALQAESVRGARPDAPVVLRLVGSVAAGHLPEGVVGPGVAMRIMTGAPLPPGADTVVPFEDTDELARRAGGVPGRALTEIGILKEPRRGDNVRPAGGDVRAGTPILHAGMPLRPAEIGVLATLGRARVRVIRRPVVAVLATGDELREPGEPLAPGKIYNSNTYSIASQVLLAGGIPLRLGIARDTITDLQEKVQAGLEADLFLTSAGVSTGEYDLVKDVLTRQGEMDFWRVRMRPGKPLAFGMLRGRDARGRERAVPHLGLPGNPVSSMIAFEQFARPAILKMQGRTTWARPTVEAVLEEPLVNDDGRRFYARGVLTKRDGRYYARLTGPQGSNVLTSMALANALIIVPEFVPRVEAGGTVRAQILEGSEDLLT
ncbi:MAG: molybdopterin molybdotransferase MoeA [Chloroflexi bacterium]|nr:molybdopterin molybdotransferase MoeA [Chloroflexota bacterium]